MHLCKLAYLLGRFSSTHVKRFDALRIKLSRSLQCSPKRNSQRHIILIVIIGLGLSACAQTSNPPNNINLLSNEYFPKHTQYQIESTEDIFKLSPQAIDFVDEIVDTNGTEKAQVTQLVGAIFDRSNLSMDYLAQANTTASETFEHASANCLSLTIMVYSMVQTLGLEAQFQEVHIPEFWTRRGGNTLLNGHINLQVLPQNTYNNMLLRKRPITIDFDPLQDGKRFSSRILTQKQMVSNFYANKAVDAMIDNNSDLAFRYLKAALKFNKRNQGAWLNLGVLFSRNSFYAEAEAAYHKLTESMSNYSTALQNLAVLYRKTGREEQAKKIATRLKNKRESNPYYHKMLGDLAFENEAYKNALKHYRNAIRLNNDPHEFHFSMAKTYMALGDIKNTRRYLENALARSEDDKMGEHYSSKLSILASR